MRPIIYVYMDTYTNAQKLFYVLYKPSLHHKKVSCNEEEWGNGEWLEVETMFEVWRIIKKPQSKTGYWIEHPHEAGPCWEFSRYECSECHEWAEDDSDYCPDCGAKMVNPQESEE